MSFQVYAPLWLESQVVRRALPGVRVVRSGMGPLRARRSAAGLWRDSGPGEPVAVIGFGGALTDGIAPGDVVVATEVRGGDRVVDCPTAGLLAAALRRRGLTVHTGPLLTVEGVVRRAEHRERLARTGAVAIDMESAAFIDDHADDHPIAAVRVVVDSPSRPLVNPRTISGGIVAVRALRRAAPALPEWAQACAPRRVLLAGPRSFCAGVERAIAVVEAALQRYGAPVYVRKQIVHNIHVVRELQAKGAVFVDEADDAPAGSTLVFSAHGVSPAVRRTAAERSLDVIDATCPLVAKVHAEARRFDSRGDTIVLIGHPGHEEVEGTYGEAPGAIRVVSDAAEVDALDVPDPARVSYLMQTTLAVDESHAILDALRRRFPDLRGPASDDICYATTNRQAAITEVAGQSDLVLVVGSPNSSNSQRLVEIAGRACARAYLIDDDTDIDLRWLEGVETVGVTAGASAPPALVERVLDTLRGFGEIDVTERAVVTESVEFSLPKEVGHG